MIVEVKHYNDLSINEFHDLIALRIQVFVIEQECPYQDLDGKDKSADHVILKDRNESIIGTARVLPPKVSYPEIAIGRVVVDENYRHLKLGHRIMEESLSFINNKYGLQNIKLSAQTHLKNFYAAHGFISTGKEYLEDGIPHTEMLLEIK